MEGRKGGREGVRDGGMDGGVTYRQASHRRFERRAEVRRWNALAWWVSDSVACVRFCSFSKGGREGGREGGWEGGMGGSAKSVFPTSREIGVSF